MENEVEETTNNVVQCRLENDKIANMINTLNGIQAEGDQTIAQLEKKVQELEGKTSNSGPPNNSSKEFSKIDRQMQEIDLQIKKVYASCKEEIEAVKSS